ncbi:MAG: OmpA family protein [Bacteroidetes bacterium]|nr:OmpA family protein [Bacteroidota bacterium]
MMIRFTHALGVICARMPRQKALASLLLAVLCPLLVRAAPSLHAPAAHAPLNAIRPGGGDCDRDGLSDEEERRLHTDPCNPDTDGDGLTDYEEVRRYNTNPLVADTDGDGLSDGQEVHEYESNPLKADSDDDGLNDGDEALRWHTDVMRPDSDDDGLSDGDEVNRYGTNPIRRDTDGDGLSDGDEVKFLHTDPRAADTDGDGLSDGDEHLRYHTDPLVADTDSDGLGDGDEVLRVGTNPLVPDTDADGVKDGADPCPLLPGRPADSLGHGGSGCPVPPRAGETALCPPIELAADGRDLDTVHAENRAALLIVLAYMNQCKAMEVVVEAHAAGEVTEKRCQEVSDVAAQRIEQWLVAHGVDPNRIEAALGYGARRSGAAAPDARSRPMRPSDPASPSGRWIALRVVRGCD